MQLKPGLRLRGAADDTELVVVRASGTDGDLECGGHPMLAMDAERPAGLALCPDLADGTQLGKRYANEEHGLEVLCTKAGAGTLTIGGDVLSVKQARALPASD